MKKLIAFALSAVMALSLAACSNTSTPKDNSVEIPNPFTECKTLEDAAEIAGFSLAVPETIDGYDQCLIQAYPGDKGVAMVEVIYRDGGKDTSNELRIRKAAGNKDISGDYNDYTNSDTVTIGTNEVTMRGNDDLASVST